MILSDRTIRDQMEQGRIVIDPLGPNAVQPASVDIRLDKEILIFRNSWRTHIDVMEPADDVVDQVTIEEGRPFLLHPGQFALGSTFESVTIPDDIVARIEGKSSLARYGLLIHSTAGFVDPWLDWEADAGVLERGHPGNHFAQGDEDRPHLLYAAHDSRG